MLGEGRNTGCSHCSSLSVHPERSHVGQRWSRHRVFVIHRPGRTDLAPRNRELECKVLGGSTPPNPRLNGAATGPDRAAVGLAHREVRQRVTGIRAKIWGGLSGRGYVGWLTATLGMALSAAGCSAVAQPKESVPAQASVSSAADRPASAIRTVAAQVEGDAGQAAGLAETVDQPADEGGGGIQDNSFLVEEAYNQEPGVVQHIFNWIRTWDGGGNRTFDFLFTQEWPVGSQTHQFSYTLPFSTFVEHSGGERVDEGGFADMLLNYRYQLLTETDRQPAVAPRFSLILPTGNEHKGLGDGEIGYQLNLPVSKELGCFAYHFNAGMTIIPDVDLRLPSGITSPKRDLIGYNLGASAILIASDKVQPLVELVALWDEQIDDTGFDFSTFELILNPGVRWAPYTKGSTQIVLGGAVPIGLSPDAANIGMFLYLSLEHPFQ